MTDIIAMIIVAGCIIFLGFRIKLNFQGKIGGCVCGCVKGCGNDLMSFSENCSEKKGYKKEKWKL
jgi:hypothetical protein